ncbi:hypothetical protein N7481_008231 [Penicillium waksmanii]|uniref:uncharacterized protein n=1 Tax=Penicillium waksmanii TaxID=69791 RepID=UPI002547D667|nr:uncharacterized protein N7481_008231 [Penicillium waksmanii]KAJ5980933.1 hypothetical protein N7481_008231 [Penicillium waksmanii]
MDGQRDSRTAPFYAIPPRRLVSVEHPAVVRNLDKAVDTLQGNAGIEKILNPPLKAADAPAQLFLRPDDPLSRPLKSTSTVSNNVLLKVTVPKRTGRKRKRGSNEPFQDAPVETISESVPRSTAKDLLRSLRDNESKYQTKPVGKVERTHVFRGMPDFVYSTVNSSFTNKFRETILPYDLAKLKQFDIDMGKGALENTDIIPPPSFSHGDVPFTYYYRQNPTVKHAVGQSGDITTINTQQPSKIRTFLVRYDIPIVPSKPQESLTPIAKLDPSLRKTVEAIKLLFEERPAWTRRALRNRLATDEHRTNLRWAVPYVGYIFRSGPWRDAIMKLGVDPRTSPDFRHYQTFMFRLLPREPDTARDGGRRHNISRTDLDEDPNSHIFTGKLPLPLDGKIWMVRDIEDPLIKSVLYKEDEGSSVATGGVPFLRETCDIISDGWFGNGALGKAKTIMRAKISSLIEDRMPEEGEFERILEFPDHAETEADLVNFMFDSATSTKRDDMLATEVRAAIKGAPVWRERLEREKLDGRKKKGKGKEVEVQHDEEQSEGEEEEMERVEMLEEEVAAAIAARDEAEGEDDEAEEED